MGNSKTIPHKWQHFSHNDLDGASPIVLTKLALGKENVYGVCCSYENIDERIIKYLNKNQDHDTAILITDIGVKDETAELLNERYKKGQFVLLIDHHPTAVEQSQRYDWMHVTPKYEDGRSTAATSLLYDYMLENNFLNTEIRSSLLVKDFVELVRLYDTWEWDAKGILKPKLLNDLFYIKGISAFIEVMTEHLNNNLNNQNYEGDFYFDKDDALILDVEQKRIEQYINAKEKQMVFTEVMGYATAIIFGEQYHSELGNALCKKYQELDFITIVEMGKKRVSFRSTKKEMDCGMLAKIHFDGGGHPPAAGCTLTEKAFDIFVKPTMMSQHEMKVS